MEIDHRVRAYLDGPRYTLWTFIKYSEKSKDPAHARRLKRAMLEELRRRHREGLVIKCRSIKGGVSYRPHDPFTVPF